MGLGGEILHAPHGTRAVALSGVASCPEIKLHTTDEPGALLPGTTRDGRRRYKLACVARTRVSPPDTGQAPAPPRRHQTPVPRHTALVHSLTRSST
jgi:hypothetical protein